MCGITGFISNDDESGKQDREDLIRAMCLSIRHRGPNEQGTLVRGKAALGIQRLSIIDVKLGHQPIYSEDGNLAIVFNGEIYNYLEIKKALESRGRRFKTNSDTEVIVQSYHEFGKDCLKLLRGMFAFAIWDFREQELFLARDRVGKKPLFYGFSKNGHFVFGSELKALLVHGGVAGNVDLSAIDAFITFGYIPEEFCIFNGVNKLEAGSFLILRDGHVRKGKYWDFEYSDPQTECESEISSGLYERIEDAVRVRLMSEVPLGAFLSGGVDSATVVALMSKLSDTPVKTFSIGFEDDAHDELKYARIVARRFETDHHEFVVTPHIVDVVDEMIWHFDEPFADPSALPTFMLAKLAKEYVTVVLSGDGGDELFGGYTRYLTHEQRSIFALVPRWVRSSILRRLSNILPHGAVGKNYLHNISLDFIERYVDSISQFNQPQRLSLYSDDFKANLDGSLGKAERHFSTLASGACADDGTSRLLFLDSKTYLPGDVMTKVDRMTMANSLEARAPLLDHELIEFAMSIPLKLKINGQQSKYIMKRAMKGIVPSEILHREKQGFGVPINSWINKQLRDRIHGDLTDRQSLSRGLFERSYIQTLLNEHSTGRRDHGYRIWLLWVLELWCRKFVDLDNTARFRP